MVRYKDIHGGLKAYRVYVLLVCCLSNAAVWKLKHRQEEMPSYTELVKITSKAPVPSTSPQPCHVINESSGTVKYSTAF